MSRVGMQVLPPVVTGIPPDCAVAAPVTKRNEAAIAMIFMTTSFGKGVPLARCECRPALPLVQQAEQAKSTFVERVSVMFRAVQGAGVNGPSRHTAWLRITRMLC